jgi:hypothetical protein
MNIRKFPVSNASRTMKNNGIVILRFTTLARKRNFFRPLKVSFRKAVSLMMHDMILYYTNFMSLRYNKNTQQ